MVLFTAVSNKTRKLYFPVTYIHLNAIYEVYYDKRYGSFTFQTVANRIMYTKTLETWCGDLIEQQANDSTMSTHRIDDKRPRKRCWS